MRFYLGVHHPNWLSTAGVPLFVSHRSLRARKTLPRAAAPWALDSGAFTELNSLGHFQTTPLEYLRAAFRYQNEIGLLDWAAPQDWMCEPFMLANTSLSVLEHQRRTTENLLELRSLSSAIRFIPVLQGWKLEDYLNHIEMYLIAGIDLTRESIVGVGSVCRRQSTAEIGQIFTRLSREGLGCHGFGVKKKGLRAYSSFLASADSMAWSLRARRDAPLPGHTHKSCANCLEYALNWRGQLLRSETCPSASLSA